ncbi:MAG: hypothetical protein IPL26_26485 [Leptospiraceae bacterium]|nr:hypothetical protein [Leptospiraceae bacterium]
MQVISEGKYTIVGKIKIHYQEYRTGEVVLLVHGWPTSSFLYRTLLPNFQKKQSYYNRLTGF